MDKITVGIAEGRIASEGRRWSPMHWVLCGHLPVRQQNKNSRNGHIVLPDENSATVKVIPISLPEAGYLHWLWKCRDTVPISGG